MKDKDLDRLFRQKLEEFEQKPTPPAWEQLNTQLKQKRRGKGWVFLSGIAASLLLLAGLWASFEFSSHIIPADPIAQEDREKIYSAPPQESKNVLQDSSASAGAEEPHTGTKNKESETEVAVIQKEINNDKTKELPDLEKTEKAASLREPVNKFAEQKALAVQTLNPAEQTKTEIKAVADQLLTESVPAEIKMVPEVKKEKIVIRYNSLDQHELKGQPSEQIAQEAPQEDNDLSARKIIGFLKKVKSNNSGNLAELREAKDELFSFRLGKPASD